MHSLIPEIRLEFKVLLPVSLVVLGMLLVKLSLSLMLGAPILKAPVFGDIVLGTLLVEVPLLGTLLLWVLVGVLVGVLVPVGLMLGAIDCEVDDDADSLITDPPFTGHNLRLTNIRSDTSGNTVEEK